VDLPTPSRITGSDPDGRHVNSITTNNKATSMSFTSTPQIILLCISWYWTSSINAIASQRLFSSSTQLASSQAIALTTLQLVVGAAVARLVLLVFGRTKNENGGAGVLLVSPFRVLTSFMKGTSGSIHFILLGLLHYGGSLCTNIGFGYGSASLVQVIKLLEPIETLLLAAFVSYMTGPFDKSIVSPNKAMGTIIIVAGTSMLLTQKSMVVNGTSVAFALVSGMCLACRNVLKKQQQQHQKQPQKQHSTSTTATFHNTFVNGVCDFANITSMSILPALMGTLMLMAYHIVFHHNHKILLQLLSPHHNDTTATTQLLDYKPLFCAITFHCLYNISSITVLSLTSAPVHSLLNVGKRIANVVAAAVVFGTPLSSTGKAGILLAGFGSCLYKKDFTFGLSARHLRRFSVYGAIITIMTVNYAVVQVAQPSTVNINNSTNTTHSIDEELTSANSSLLI